MRRGEERRGEERREEKRREEKRREEKRREEKRREEKRREEKRREETYYIHRRPRRRWEDNIKKDSREVGYDDRDWINLAQAQRWQPHYDLTLREVGNLSGDTNITQILQTDTRRTDHSTTTSAQKRNKRFGIERIFKLATWNARGIIHKEIELEKELYDQNIDVAIISETKKKMKGSANLKDYYMIYNGVPQE
ncbi:hypothetical protein ANN_24384 [Periplaneta americana]|uniref:Uncharacterized protein n=1 Tax=Periplaneta americana TaxID=6978 RepID=A0ABQ8S383_PERAM|nr:hypothetical protein ANN_24384 [Periplaneta americana]